MLQVLSKLEVFGLGFNLEVQPAEFMPNSACFCVFMLMLGGVCCKTPASQRRAVILAERMTV